MATANRKRGYGNGTVYFRQSDQRWVGKYKIGTKPDGKPDVKVVYGKTETECHRKLKAAIEEANKTQYVYVKKETVSDFINTWLTTVKKLELKPKSYDRLEQTINYDVIPHIGSIQVGALTSDDVQSMLADMKDAGKAYSSVKKAYDAVNALYKWGLSTKPPKVKDNPVTAVKIPSKKLFEQSEIKFYTKEEAAIISRAALAKYKCGTPHYPLGGAVVLAINTGLRLGELIALEWDRDVDLENKILYVHHTIVTVKDRSGDATKKYVTQEQDTTKSEAGQDRPIPLNDDAIIALNTLKIATGKSKYVLATKDGKRKSARDIDKLVRRVILRAGFPEDKVYGPHSLRHTFATLLLMSGIDVKIVSELLGHSSVSITYNTYIHVIKEQKAKAISSLPNIVSATKDEIEK